MEENPKWYSSTWVIILMFVLCWPIAVVLLILKNVVNTKIDKKSKLFFLQGRQKTYQTIAVIFLILTLIFLSASIFNTDEEWADRIGGSVLFLAMFGVPTFVLFKKANNLKKTINNVVIYNDLIVIRSITSIRELSNRLSISQEQVLKDVSELIRKKHLDGYIKNEKEIILKEVNDKQFSIRCKNCGAENIYIENKENICEYCGSLLSRQ